MAQPFTFPPPPPPPPRKDSLPLPNFSNYSSPYGSYGRDRGSDFSRGRGRGDASRGRGFLSRGRASRGRFLGEHRRDSFDHNWERSEQNLAYTRGHIHYGQSPQYSSPSPYQGQKRPYSTAFIKPATTSSRPQAAPAVPIFGGDILLPTTSPSKDPSMVREKPRKCNQLGLTPASQDHQSSSDSDEETKLAKQTLSGKIPDGAILQFEHKGRAATLQTAADIVAWIAERKKNYPTTAKVEAARREADEKRKKWEGGRKGKAEAQTLHRVDREKIRQEDLRKRALESLGSKRIKKEDVNPNGASKKDDVTKDTVRMEKLRRKLEKAQRDGRKAEQALARMQKANVATEKDQPESAFSHEAASKQLDVGVLPTAQVQIGEGMLKLPDELERMQAELVKDGDDAISNASTASSRFTLSTLDDSDDDSSDEATSSSGSSSVTNFNPKSSHAVELEAGSGSGSDSDSIPEALTSKRTAPDRVLPLLRNNTTSSMPSTVPLNDNERTRAPCRNIIRTGRCQFGNRCRYSHDLTKGSQRVGDGDEDEGLGGKEWERRVQGHGQGLGRGHNQGHERSKENKGRKGLYQVLVEKELEEERRAVVQVIVEMGERGMLGEAKAQPNAQAEKGSSIVSMVVS